MAKIKPTHEVRLGAIKAVIWENKTESGVRHNVTFQRLYKDGDEWKSTHRFGQDDLPHLAAVADEAYRWILEEVRKNESEWDARRVFELIHYPDNDPS